MVRHDNTKSIHVCLRLQRLLPVALVLFLSFAEPSLGQPTGTVTQPLVLGSSTTLWTKNGNHVPMCWHELLQFPSVESAKEAQAFVRKTIEEGWISHLNLRITWEECPTSGPKKHVRVKLRSGDASNHGTTIKVGMEALSTSDQRPIPPPNDPPGLLMGFPANWNQDDHTRAEFRSLILHEFGHILGFDHEQRRTDGPVGVACYENSFPNAIKLGPADPQSIMGWSYCTEALGILTANDINAARSVYGVSPVRDQGHCSAVSVSCTVTETIMHLLLLN